jgi:hypothetical protein
MRHDILGILLSFGGMARLAIIGADHHMNVIIDVVKRIGMRFGSEHVAFRTAHHHILQVLWNIATGYLAGGGFHCHGVFGGYLGVTAFLPATDDARMNSLIGISAAKVGPLQKTQKHMLIIIMRVMQHSL